VFNYKNNSAGRFLVLGDLILDRYIEGHVKRISPEAPVPILLQKSERDVLGGAGNVANNIRALGGEAYLVGVLGNDRAAETIKRTAEQNGTRIFAVIDNDRCTTVKTRLLGDRQQLLRVDNEDVGDISNQTQNILLKNIDQLLPQVDAVVISDYRKGTLTSSILNHTIQQAKRSSVPVFVDPKGREYTHYIGADFIKPNRSELELLTKMSCDNFHNVAKAAAFLSKETGANVLVTLSQDGMILFKKDGSKFSLRTEAKEVFDVSGAGDTAIASFAFAICQGETAENAAKFANISAGIAVSKIGTVAVSLDEIVNSANKLHFHSHLNQDDFADLHAAVKIRLEWEQQGFKVGFTNGCFDLLHPGHITLLRAAAAECDRLIVGVNSDASVRRLKGPARPIQYDIARAEVLKAIDCVDLVVIFNEDTPLEIIKLIKPDVLIKGSDYKEEDIVGAEFVKASGGSIVRVQLLEGHSTTNLVKRSNAS
jgi:D-beta-D-heptose 7-phosphate kinase / D-beta-D-heptose 1-phosphate adenosyltransferase